MDSLAIVACPHKSYPLGHVLNLKKLRGRRFVPSRPRNLFNSVLIGASEQISVLEADMLTVSR
jgi:hypothetical protein